MHQKKKTKLAAPTRRRRGQIHVPFAQTAITTYSQIDVSQGDCPSRLHLAKKFSGSPDVNKAERGDAKHSATKHVPLAQRAIKRRLHIVRSTFNETIAHRGCCGGSCCCVNDLARRSESSRDNENVTRK